MAGKHTRRRYCAVCRTPRERAGWCDRCRAVAVDIKAALGEDRVKDDNGKGGERAKVGLDAQRRLEIHRARAGLFRLARRQVPRGKNR